MSKKYTGNFFVALALFLFATSFSLAQNDVILKNDGTEMKGKVTAIDNDNVHFIYENETVEYTVAKSDMVKITFGSGRVEFFNKPAGNSAISLEDHHNKVAVLPFGYLKDQETSNPIMQKQIQEETYSIFRSKAQSLNFQDPRTTNALLAKAGVNNDNIDGYTMGEIANILSVEYMVQGMVSINKSSVTSYRNTNTTTKSDRNNNAYIDRHGNIIGDIWNTNKRKTSSSSFGSESQNYVTNITMNIYTDKGDTIFTKEHESFWQTEDAYKVTLAYLAKRTPLFKK